MLLHDPTMMSRMLGARTIQTFHGAYTRATLLPDSYGYHPVPKRRWRRTCAFLRGSLDGARRMLPPHPVALAITTPILQRAPIIAVG